MKAYSGYQYAWHKSASAACDASPACPAAATTRLQCVVWNCGSPVRGADMSKYSRA